MRREATVLQKACGTATPLDGQRSCGLAAECPLLLAVADVPIRVQPNTGEFSEPPLGLLEALLVFGREAPSHDVLAAELGVGDGRALIVLEGRKPHDLRNELALVEP